jgi:hypothetical protein
MESAIKKAIGATTWRLSPDILRRTRIGDTIRFRRDRFGKPAEFKEFTITSVSPRLSLPAD